MFKMIEKLKKMHVKLVNILMYYTYIAIKYIIY